MAFRPPTGPPVKIKPIYFLSKEENPLYFMGYSECPSKCRMRVYMPKPVPSDAPPSEQVILPAVVIFTELPDNPGTSVTNRAEMLATLAWNRIARVALTGMIFIEHYPEDPLPNGNKRRPGDLLGERFARVRFDWSTGEARRPQWTYITLADLVEMGLPFEEER